MRTARHQRTVSGHTVYTCGVPGCNWLVAYLRHKQNHEHRYETLIDELGDQLLISRWRLQTHFSFEHSLSTTPPVRLCFLPFVVVGHLSAFVHLTQKRPFQLLMLAKVSMAAPGGVSGTDRLG